jgi:hypothetical protein
MTSKRSARLPRLEGAQEPCPWPYRSVAPHHFRRRGEWVYGGLGSGGD